MFAIAIADGAAERLIFLLQFILRVGAADDGLVVSNPISIADGAALSWRVVDFFVDFFEWRRKGG